MIDKTKIIKAVSTRLKDLSLGRCLEVRAYKRNRSVVVVKMSDDELPNIESGYFTDRCRVNIDKFGKLLRTMMPK